MSGKVVIALTVGASQEKTFVFDTHDIFLFGRKDDCHACLPDDQLVSRHHFVMEVNPPHACVRDLGSLHGTIINGVKYGGRQKHETPEEGARRQYPGGQRGRLQSAAAGERDRQLREDRAAGAGENRLQRATGCLLGAGHVRSSQREGAVTLG